MKKFFTVIEKVQRGPFGNIIGGRIQIRGGRKGRGKLYKAATWSGNRGKEAAWGLLAPTSQELIENGLELIWQDED